MSVYRGLKVLELGAGAAGPIATRYLAEQGATVVRVESAKRPDFLRMLHVNARNRDEPGILDRAPMFAALNADKRSVAIDWKHPQGVALVEQLVGWADVVSENFAPGVLERVGLGPEEMLSVRPDLILARSCLFGQTGPQRHYPGFGGQGAAIAGFNHLTGDRDGPALGPYGTITDTLSPRYVAVAIAAALFHRARTGEGRVIDVSQIETGVYSLSEMMARYAASGERLERCGNESEFDAPHGVYPCAGDDRWIAIAVRSDSAWRALVDVLGRPAWAAAHGLDASEGRLASREILDRELASWTAHRPARDVMQRLREAGVEAGVVQRPAELLEDPQLAARGHFVATTHEALGPMPLERSGVRLRGAPGGYHRAGPRLGADTDAVLREALGLSHARIQHLRDAGVLQ